MLVKFINQFLVFFFEQFISTDGGIDRLLVLGMHSGASYPGWSLGTAARIGTTWIL